MLRGATISTTTITLLSVESFNAPALVRWAVVMYRGAKPAERKRLREIISGGFDTPLPPQIALAILKRKIRFAVNDQKVIIEVPNEMLTPPQS
jgi:hypothetical protein